MASFELPDEWPSFAVQIPVQARHPSGIKLMLCQRPVLPRVYKRGSKNFQKEGGLIIDFAVPTLIMANFTLQRINFGPK